MADKLRIVYSEVLKAANVVAQEAHAISALHDRLAADADQLHHAGLRGYTSDVWYKDMAEILLPKTKELASILQAISDIINVLVKLYQNAEQESAQVFKKQDTSSTSPATSMEELKAESQRLGQLQDTMNNVIKNIGEGLQNAARQ